VAGKLVVVIVAAWLERLEGCLVESGCIRVFVERHKLEQARASCVFDVASEQTRFPIRRRRQLQRVTKSCGIVGSSCQVAGSRNSGEIETKLLDDPRRELL
jgi:hypothetical protein